MANKCFCLLLLAFLFAIAAAQYYTQYNPYNTPSPTFSSLAGYYYATPSPYLYGQQGNQFGQTQTNFDNGQIRIWPYVVGQYIYPTYNNNDYYNPYASLNTINGQGNYLNPYQNFYGKK